MIPFLFTMLRIVLAPFIYWNIVNGEVVAAILLAFVAALSDFFDGFLARQLNEETYFGKVLDPIADKIFLGFSLVALLVAGYIPFFIVIILLAKDLILLIMGSYFMYYHKKKMVKISYISKITTAFQSIMLLLFLVEWNYIHFVYWPVIILTIYTAIDYGINHNKYMVRK